MLVPGFASHRRILHDLLVGAAVAAAVGLAVPSPAAPGPAGCRPAAEAGMGEAVGFDRLGEILLFSGVPQGSAIALDRVTLRPGETLDLSGVSYAALAVESGTLGFAFVTGFGIHHASSCGPGGGSATIGSDGRSWIGPGQALVAEDIPVGTIVAEGSEPLSFLLMALVPAEIDSATSQPILDGVASARIAYRERQRLRRACKDGTIGTPTPAADGDAGRRLPKACREQERVS